jgi:hypothetical protein
VEVPLLLQFSIALFTGMVAATFVPPVRRAIPRPIEVVLWVAFVCVCVAGVSSVNNPSARELSASAMWGADQIFNTMVGLMLGGIGVWASDHRFAIGSWLVILAGADILFLMLLRSMRTAQSWRPRVRLGEWMEIPLATPQPASRKANPVAADTLAGINRRIAATTAVAATAALARMIEVSIWVRDALLASQALNLSRATAAGRV